MARDPKAEAALALHRFGFGPRSGSIAAIASDPRGALIAELDRPGAGRINDPDLLTGGEAARAAFNFRQERKARRLAERAEREAAKNAPPAAPAQEPAMAAKPVAPDKPAALPGLPQQVYLEEAKARIDAALGADLGFVERLVWFWSNHFCVSADKGPVRALCGAYEREAIRAHVLGRFADMLNAVESHPAMLIYLDNARSIGPDSIAGRNQHRGLNENLAREILELHTLGVRTVYTQADVTNFAKVITGWSIIPPRQDPERGGEFTFNPRMHEPGAQTVIGRSYPEGGIEQGRAVLADLARHPATARHIAAKLARAFVADAPPPALVDRLAKRFLDTDGNLKELARTLVSAPEAWAAPRTKLKAPGTWFVAALRAIGITPPDIRPVVQAQNLLGEPLWRPPAPKGFSDDSAAWMDGISERVDVANQLAGRVAALVDPEAAVDTALGPLASAETRRTIARAASRPQALALLLMAPEFQRS
ncbi:MAG TPA: DUF1800 family protein [Xanthobacteraceae bacterium]|jgi:uncharacterized protein (DUF1800 family)|nr:DUF1800 family protein [Xanthobacteraceae bacterium]